MPRLSCHHTQLRTGKELRVGASIFMAFVLLRRYDAVDTHAARCGMAMLGEGGGRDSCEGHRRRHQTVTIVH